MPLPSVHNVFKLASSLIVAGAILLVAGPAFALGARANYVEVASWETGYQAQYTITNDGPGDVTAWRVIFDLPPGSSTSSTWDAVRSGSGQHLIFDNAAWNGTLAPGSSTSFGFVVVGLGRPVGCTVNGGPCDTLPPLAVAPDRDVGCGWALAGAIESVALRCAVNAAPPGRRQGRERGTRRAARRARATRRR
ncbi:MAG TPA: cellulose binding domain-containing protein [Kofleriaceae bacterium]|nr:cellulose binding domain-containing protein [Kofleriaceae bacterium]